MKNTTVNTKVMESLAAFVAKKVVAREHYIITRDEIIEFASKNHSHTTSIRIHDRHVDTFAGELNKITGRSWTCVYDEKFLSIQDFDRVRIAA